MSEVSVLFNGYSIIKDENEMIANCTCTLIKAESLNIIIDTMTPWDSDKIVNALMAHQLTAKDINYVISTHGHSDHTGNNNLFLEAKHLVGFSLSYKDTYFMHPFDKGEELKLNENIRIIPTPGHTLSDVTVIVTTGDGTYAITGDLFEKYEDIDDPTIWVDAGSEDQLKQAKNRSMIADLADWIVPGHGPMFKVTQEIREALKKQVQT
ncbi:metallo-beta-lactamase domain-containing protein 1 isoform X2 [Aricia agestis]|uniref:metallo-beta-lactamase domain-containing protein 1 isoform X2 n=1 Tax=Aricia agestis TaxID=91739 RepID=UPI001C206C49|nr:metallo-beta-lactamase domain-containing protein 1 isoform X2 [Aricia agestis]